MTHHNSARPDKTFPCTCMICGDQITLNITWKQAIEAGNKPIPPGWKLRQGQYLCQKHKD